MSAGPARYLRCRRDMREEDGVYVGRCLYAAASGTHTLREYQSVVHGSAAVLMPGRDSETQSARGSVTAVADRMAARIFLTLAVKF